LARVLFIQEIWYEYFGTMYISATLKSRGHECDVVVDHRPDRINKAVKEISPDIIAFSCLTGSYRWCLEVARDLKKSYGALIVFGGHHPTISPEIIEEDPIDVICRGEGEHPMLELADAVDTGADISGILNLWVKTPDGVVKNDIRPLITELDRLPTPDRSLYRKYPYFKRQKVWHVMAGRGCPYECAYCHNHVLKGIYKGKGPYVRQRSIESVLSEISELKDNIGPRYIFFSDDVFSSRKQWLLSFLEQYKKRIHIPFLCTVTPRELDEDTVKALKDAGCYHTSLYFETGNEKKRLELLNKRTPDAEFLRCAELLHKYRLPFFTGTMMGLPGETLDDSIESVKFNWELKPSYAWSSLFQPYPATRLSEYAIERGFISRKNLDNFEIGAYSKSLLAQGDINAIVNLHRLYFLASRFPSLLPVIRRLVKLPPNPVFNLIFLPPYVYYLLCIQKLTMYQVLKNGLWQIKSFLLSKGK
jgi:radical SAM superfamily enzyme YgiQ (UPF0313 family)